VEFLLELPAYRDKLPTPARRAGDEDGAVDGSMEVGGTAAAARRAGGVLEVGSDTQGAQYLLSLTRNTNTSDNTDGGAAGIAAQQEVIEPDTPVSVLICAPTQALAAAYDDRFQRCLHRLRGVLDDGCAVMPGAGVPEVLCMTHIDELLARTTRSHLAPGEEGEEQRWVEVEVLRAFRDVLFEYVLRIGVNNGINHVTMQQRMHQCAQGYRDLARELAGEGSGAQVGVLEAVRPLSAQQKLSLPAAVDLVEGYDAPEQKHVLDPVGCRIAAVHAALLVVKQTL
jgi:hypothetical protein